MIALQHLPATFTAGGVPRPPRGAGGRWRPHRSVPTSASTSSTSPCGSCPRTVRPSMLMRLLARECGLNPAAIYHYFESKDALLAAVIDERRGARLAEVPRHPRRPAAGRTPGHRVPDGLAGGPGRGGRVAAPPRRGAPGETGGAPRGTVAARGLRTRPQHGRPRRSPSFGTRRRRPTSSWASCSPGSCSTSSTRRSTFPRSSGEVARLNATPSSPTRPERSVGRRWVFGPAPGTLVVGRFQAQRPWGLDERREALHERNHP